MNPHTLKLKILPVLYDTFSYFVTVESKRRDRNFIALQPRKNKMENVQ